MRSSRYRWIGLSRTNSGWSRPIFQLISQRYERKSITITTNLTYSEWDKVFLNPLNTAAAVDRIIHKGETFNVQAPSWRTEAAKKKMPAKVYIDRPPQQNISQPSTGQFIQFARRVEKLAIFNWRRTPLLSGVLMQLSDKNKTYSKGCSFCFVINAILEKGPKYWGPQPPPKAWKRWTLLFCSVLFSVGIPILIFSLFSRQIQTVQYCVSGDVWILLPFRFIWSCRFIKRLRRLCCAYSWKNWFYTVKWDHNTWF